jgi:4-hydroxy-tetrahydrodipicolinate synthase
MSQLRKGIIAAVWTPTDAAGRILEAELKANLEFVRRGGVHGLMVLGSTGEFLHLSIEARKRFLELVQKHAGGLPIIANISEVNPGVVADLGRHARALGVDCVSVLPPWYYPVAQDDLVEFFVRAGEASQLPLCLYNFPERTGNRLSLETIAAVADRVPVASLKQSGNEFEYHVPLVALARQKNFVILTGGEIRLVEAMALGATGCISGLLNAMPELVKEIYDAVKAGATDRAREATARIQRVGVLVEALEFPLNVAAAIEARGLAVGHSKTPLSAATQARYAKLVADLRSLYREIGLAG